MMRRFKRTPIGAILSPEAKDRQAQAVRSAQEALGDIEAIRAFLNTVHPKLGVRPLDLAIESDDGLAAVEQALKAEKRAA